jgi:CRISPR system Cascade subunit CasE
MYLSKILIWGTACRNPYEIHRALWRIFPEDTRAQRDFLFRVEQPEKGQAEILMQSDRQPEISTKTARILAFREYPLSFHVGQRLRFLLVANPVKTINDELGRINADGEPKKCRVPLIREEEQRSWIERKFQPAISLEALIIGSAVPLRFRKTREDRAGKVQPVVFQGIMKVEDPEALVGLVRDGVGPAKAFGCGLLSLARA